MEKKPGLNLVEVVKDYVDNMLAESSGRKALILDKETLAIVSLVYSRTTILQKEVFYIEVIDNIPDEKLTHLKALFFLRCTDDNLQKVCNELKDPTFSQYSLYFSSTVPHDKVQRIADADTHNVVVQVQEVFADFSTINDDLFTLNIPSIIPLTKPVQRWSVPD